MPFIKNSWKVADITALKALTPSSYPKQEDGDVFQVDNIGDSTPGFYLFILGGTTTEDLPSIVEPTNNSGRYVLFGANSTGSVILTVSNSVPTGSPPSITPTTGGKICKHYQITSSYGSYTFKEWTGVDSTGTLGNNGWVSVTLT